MTTPEPPSDFPSRNLPIVTLDARVATHRFHNAAFGPTYYDRNQDGRLNAPGGEYGVLYVAQAVEGAFAESFLRNPGNTLLASDFLAAKAYAQMGWKRPLRFAQFYGPGLAIMGATAEISHGPLPYSASHRWSQAIHDHPDIVDGIAYRSRHDDDQICYAVFDRAETDGLELSRDLNLDAAWFYELMDVYRVGLSVT